MPLTSSAKKALKRSEFLKDRNAVFKIAMKRAIKAVRKASAEGNKNELPELVKQAHSAIDKALRRNVMHKNNAARKKSRLSKLVS